MDGAGLSAALFCAFLGAAAGAQTLGEIEAYLDGEPRYWHTIMVDRGERQFPTAMFRVHESGVDLFLQGHSGPVFSTEQVISIDLRLGPDLEPVSGGLLYLPGGIGGPLWTTQDALQASQFDVLSIDFSDDGGHVEAIFEGEICLSTGPTLRSEPATCRDVAGRVLTELVAYQPTPP